MFIVIGIKTTKVVEKILLLLMLSYYFACIGVC